MENGAFLVFRRLAQKVPEFDASVRALRPLDLRAGRGLAPSCWARSWSAAGRAVRRVVLSPVKDDLSLAEGTPRENDFEFGDDREGVRCPWAAHVRKAYPRDDVRHDTTPTERRRWRTPRRSRRRTG